VNVYVATGGRESGEAGPGRSVSRPVPPAMIRNVKRGLVKGIGGKEAGKRIVVAVMTVKRPVEIVEGILAVENGLEQLEGIDVGKVGRSAVGSAGVERTLVGKGRRPEVSLRRSVHRGVQVGLFLGVAQDLVRLGDFLELVFGLRMLVLVRMILQGQLPVRFLDVRLRRVLGHPQHPVVVLSRHRCSKLSDCRFL